MMPPMRLGELALQPRSDAIGRIFLGFLMIAENEVTAPSQHHRRGGIVNAACSVCSSQPARWLRIVQLELTQQLVGTRSPRPGASTESPAVGP